ncbi:histone-lysine N-methyltransferase SETMAR [Rana temporaria]|uniref:histone-lysine N-methyltransferase SETMAR n=1 Tax=Rana temporaria TaxID=8407 RepID=UPI001AADE0D3|nr:histone-lysine N-methyltransferase SETMAR [Rana temporaria]
MIVFYQQVAAERRKRRMEEEDDVCGGQEALPVCGGPRGELGPFQYTPELIAGPGADVDPSEVTIQGCECRGRSCVEGRCPCLPRGQNYVNGRVTLARDTPILECNVLCSCAETCANRETQRSLQFRLEVRQIPGKGWGLRTKEAIPSGRFVCEYAGEVLGEEEACLRIKSQDPTTNNYIIAVREHLHDGRTLRTYVDPTRIGNIGRFLNHSCRPNLAMLPVRSHSMVPRLALFAARDIPAGEELCYDYSGRSFNAEPPSAGDEGPGPRKRCLCGTDVCAGDLPFDGSLYGDKSPKSANHPRKSPNL